jgi:hypothetical protein
MGGLASVGPVIDVIADGANAGGLQDGFHCVLVHARQGGRFSGAVVSLEGLLAERST